MKKLLFASVLALSFGCGQKTPTALEKASAAQMIPVQQTVTRYDLQGRPYAATETVMVPVGGLPSVPAVTPEPIRVVPGTGERLYIPVLGEKLNAPPKQKGE